jgi:putative addiction module CopG family antidote
MNVSLGNRWERFVDAAVQTGDFQTASEVLREGLRLLEERYLIKQLSVNSIEELQGKLLAGIKSLDQGQGIEGEQAFKNLKGRIKERKSRG